MMKSIILNQSNFTLPLSYSSEKINDVDAWARAKGIDSYLPNIGILTKNPSIFPYADKLQNWHKYVYLLYLIEGALCSNDLIANVSSSANGEKPISRDVQIYSAVSGKINNNFLEDIIGSTTNLDGVKYNVTLNNFRIKNNHSTKFINYDSTNADCNKFTSLIPLSSPHKIYFSPTTMKYGNFQEEYWTRGKDAIGINFNKYLSEIIELNNDNACQMNSFVSDSVLDDLNMLFNGQYSYLNANNEEIRVDKPLYITVKNEGMTNEKSNPFSKIVSDISANGLNNIFGFDKNEDCNFFTRDMWKSAWHKFGIKLDNSGCYPLYVPKQDVGEFFAIAKIDNFLTKNSYHDMRNEFRDGHNIKLVVWINDLYRSYDEQVKQLNDEIQSLTNRPNSPQIQDLKNRLNAIENKFESDVLSNPAAQKDGYFIVKMKACFDEEYDTDITTNRKYRVSDDTNMSYDASMQWFKNILLKQDPDTGEYVYLYSDKYANKSDSNNWFKGEYWDVNEWKIDYDKLWYDLLENPSDLESPNWTYDDASRIKNDFIEKLDKSFLQEMINIYGEKSDEVKNVQKAINRYIFVNKFFNIITDNKNFVTDGIPYIIDRKLWENLDAYIEYKDLDNSLHKLDKDNEMYQTCLDRYNNNAFKKFLDENDLNPSSKLKNIQITGMLDDCQWLADNLFKIKCIVPNKKYDPSLPKSEKNPEKIMYYSGANPASDNIDGEFVNSEAKTQYNKFKKFLNLGSSAINNNQFRWYVDNPDYKDGVNNSQPGMRQWLQENKVSQLFKDDYSNIFKKLFGKDLVNNLVSNVVFETGDNVNDGFVFSSMEELLNDPFINVLFDEYNIDKEQFFIKKPIKINDTNVDGEFYYELNDEINKTLPFSIGIKKIGDSFYYTATAKGENLNLNVDYDLAKKLASITDKTRSNNGYKVLDSNGRPFIESTKSLDEVHKIMENIENSKNVKINDKNEWNAAAFFVVIGIPIIITSGVILAFYIKKKAKEKTKF